MWSHSFHWDEPMKTCGSCAGRWKNWCWENGKQKGEGMMSEIMEYQMFIDGQWTPALPGILWT